MVSVIIPVYNAEKTLTICVQSVLDQTYKDWELILIDDGSQDGSGLICDQVQERCKADHMLCQVIHQPNRGVSAARNCGMEYARGEYFVFVDSDDQIEPCYLEDLVHTTEAHPELGHVICGFKCTSNNHNYILSKIEPLTIVTRLDYMRLYDEVLIQGPCLALYKREFVNKHRIRMREDLSLAEDLIFNLEYLDALGNVPIGIINKTNYNYHNNDPSSLSRYYRSNLLEINEMIIRTLKDYLKEWGVVSGRAWKSYYATVIYKYINVLDNTFKESCPLTKREKIKYNNDVLLKRDFVEAMSNSDIRLPRSLRLAFTYRDYRVILLSKSINKIKQAIRESVIQLKEAGMVFFKRVFNKIWNIRHSIYLWWKRKCLKNHNFSIISRNCVGGVMSHDLGERFNSPTVNLWLKPDDFIFFCNELDYFLNCKIEEVFEEGINYPIGRMYCEDKFITLYFTHYSSFSEAVNKWQERARRVNKDNLFVVFEYPAILDTTEEQESMKRKFDTIPFANKIMITKRSQLTGENIVHMSFYDETHFPGKILSRKNRISVKRYLDDFDYVSFLNSGRVDK